MTIVDAESFTYDAFTDRNIGFVSAAEQAQLRDGCVFIAGVGGMGGAALMALARAGVGRFVIADIDQFEVSNLNRQVFATVRALGQDKAEVAAASIRQINPDVRVEVLGGSWPHHIDRIVQNADVVVNGTDDLAAGLCLYRTARASRKPVIDAYASPLPSVYVTRPGAPMPEERLGYPTLAKAWTAITAADRRAAFLAEVEYVMLHSSSRHHIDLAIAAEVAAGRRSRMSFAPMVITTGMLMAYEAVALLTGKESGTDQRGWFFNPHRPAVERPYPAPVAALLRPFVRKTVRALLGA
jgi:hypothetical protein